MIRQTHTKEQFDFDSGTGWLQQMKFGKKWDPSQFPGDIPQRMCLTVAGPHLNYTPYAIFSCAYGEANVYTEKGLQELIEKTNQYGKMFVFTAARDIIKLLTKKYKDNVTVLAHQETWMGKYDVWLCVSHT